MQELGRESSASRLRWLAVFALLLLATTTVPLISTSPAKGSEEPPAEELPAPDVTAIELEELEHTEWLSSPEAVSQREASRTAYTNLSASEAQSLFLEAFLTQLKELNADPARFLSELEIEEPLGTYGARVSIGEGESALVESAVPVESDLGGEGKEPVDLALKAVGNEFVSENPLTEVELPGSAEEPIQLQSGVEVTLPTNNDHSAQPLGDKNLFYPGTDISTDTLLSPIAGGVEVFEQLRSPESPEQFSFVLSLPAGASLHSRADGGAELISASEEEIGEVPPPYAVDAQGAEVPVTMNVEGDSLVLEVPHRLRDVAYPLLVDPQLLDSPAFGSGEWHPSATATYTLTNNGSSLSAVSKGNVSYPANTFGQWVYTAPGETTFIEAATFSSVYFFVNKCFTSQPHGYTGIYNAGSNTYKGGLYSGGDGYTPSYWTGLNGGVGYRNALIGIGTGGASTKIACAHELYVGGVTAQENDPEAPTINSVSGIPSSGWFDPAKVGNATIVATDPGFGLTEIAITDGGVTNTNLQHCSGLSGNRCPRQLSWTVPPPYVGGERTLEVTAEDALGKHTAWTRTTKVDTSAPEIDLGGQLAYVTNEEGLHESKEQEASESQLSLPVYGLHIKAIDGNGAGSPKERQSGVKSIDVFLDGVKKEVPWKAQSCTQVQASCAMEVNYELSLAGLAAGEHTLKVVATDQVDHASPPREIVFEYIPATGMKDEYAMQRFPLPDGEGDESEEEDPKRPELAVNVMNGNLVYRQRDVEVSGPAVDLELERFYNSQLPEADNTEWGDGWTLAQTPKLELEEEEEQEAPPQRAAMVSTSGALARAVVMPTEPDDTRFSTKLQATVTKEPDGGYEIADQSGETATSLSFDEAGKVTELLTPGYARVDYSYEEGVLSEVAVHDPASLKSTEASKEPKLSPEEFEAPAYVGSFGGEGSGPGRLDSPSGIATDPEGNVWVADTGHDRIQGFNSKGEFLGGFGMSGSEDGKFYEPRGIAIDAQGNVWVADKAKSRIQEFNSKGEFIRAFGSYGTANGKFTSLQGLAVAPGGHVWAIDGSKTKPRVQEFSATGTYLSQFGIVGSEDGQLKEPQGIAIDPQGDIWIADTANNRIQEFNSKGEFIRKFGSEGAGNGQLRSPTALAIDPEGNVWVTDAANNRIQEFSATGTYLSQFGTAGNESGQFSEPHGIAIDANGNVWIADTANHRVQQLTASEFIRKFGGEGSEAGQLSSPADVATDPQGNVWVADTGHNRIQEFNSKGEFIRQFGAKGSGPGLFSAPHGIATDSEGNVWVADTGNYRIQEFNSKGEFIRQFGSKGTANGKFIEVWDVAIDPAGNVWTVDASATISRVQEFNSKGEYLRKFGSFGTGYNQFRYPKGITADLKGNIWVADSNNNRIAEYAPDGKVIRMLEGHGAGNGQVEYPAGITADSEGNIWVADTENNRVQQLSSEGTYLGQFGTPGNEDGQLSSPQGIAVDINGNVWIADTRNDRVQEVAASEFVRKFGGSGSGAGQLSKPDDIATDPEGNVWIADTWHNRVQQFNRDGEFIRQVGSAGSGNGTFYSPLGLATDSEGNLWVAEGNHVQAFSSKGAFIRRFGGIGQESGQFSNLRDVAIGPEGHVWTLEGGPVRVQEFSVNGEPLSQFGNQGSGDGQLHEPDDIAIDPEGNVWIADAGNHRVQVFNAAGEYIRKFGGFGFSNGRLNYPSGIAIDAKGIVWVADSANDRVQAFTTEGTYLGQFGVPGNYEGQLYSPQGVATDAEGNVWVADTWNDRVQKWQIPRYVFKHAVVYDLSFGSSGSAGGEFDYPGDVAVGSDGSLWVADRAGNRIEEFDKNGEFVATFGKNVNQTEVEAGGSQAEKNFCTAASGDTCQAGQAGSSSGQLSRPSSLAIDPKGNVWVADTGNSRIQVFDETGEYLSQFGSLGSGNGQFREPEGIAIDPKGNLWVSDTYNGRIQQFTGAGDFIRVVGSNGSGPGQIGEPTGIDIGPGGNVWIADWENYRIAGFEENGKFIREFGTVGTANGQFVHPDGLTVDSRGQIWVADEGNNRVQAFTEKGEYIAKFGSQGSGEGQFSFGYPIGVETDSKGSLWITDAGNDRVQRWGVFNYVPAGEGAVVEDTPRVQVSESGGLVESLEGEEVSPIEFDHEGELLSAVDGPQGETAYEYDDAERLTKVTLPNGTWGEVAYDSSGRVKSVTVSIEGSKAKTTYFAYSNEPRRTEVSPEGEATTTYDIGADGSVIKWRTAPSIPTIELTGSLYYQRGEVYAETISPGDQSLVVDAFSDVGVASIQLVANGNQLVTEKTCSQDYAVPGVECEHEEKTWVTETESWPPGILQLEVIVTDSLGRASSQRFWVNVPYTPPPNPEAPGPPKFNDVLKFREEYGLDIDVKGNEQVINERVFELIAKWHNPSTPEGEVARATEERWGVPLRAIDVVELEFRQAYVAQASALIPQWVETHAPSTYAGYYVDHRQGGIIHVGFTENQANMLDQLKEYSGIMAPSRLFPFSVSPKHSYLELIEDQVKVSEHFSALPGYVRAAIGIEQNAVVVGTTASPMSMTAALTELLGTDASVSVILEPSPGQGRETKETDRDRFAGRIFAGDRIYNEKGGACTAAFGSWLEGHSARGARIFKHFLFTAAHCGLLNEQFTRGKFNKKTQFYEYNNLGTVRRRGVESFPQVDASAILLQGKATGWAPRQIYLGPRNAERSRQPITGIATPSIGLIVCTSGATTNKVLQGEIVRPPEMVPYGNFPGIQPYQIPIDIPQLPGDSGAPVWICGTGNALGLWNASTPGGSESLFAPLIEYPGATVPGYEWMGNPVPGVLNKLGFSPGQLSYAQ